MADITDNDIFSRIIIRSSIYFYNIYEAFYRYDHIIKHYVKGVVQ